MGSLRGHVFPGLGFFLFGLWHLFNHVKLHALQPNSYTSSPWFPVTKKRRYFELYFIMIATFISMSMELIVGPSKHHPFDVDGTIPTNHLHNFEHSLISFSMFVYAVLAILIDKIKPKSHDQFKLEFIIAAMAFGQELLLFHLHSTDHHGLEGQYHLLLQIIILISLSTTLLGIGLPNSFMVSFVRSVSIVTQGIWLVIIGVMLYTPALVPKGCFLYDNDQHLEVRCSSDEALYRAKSLTNILFSWVLSLITIYAASFYLAMVKVYGEKGKYSSLTTEAEKLVGQVEFALPLLQEFDELEGEKPDNYN